MTPYKSLVTGVTKEWSTAPSIPDSVSEAHQTPSFPLRKRIQAGVVAGAVVGTDAANGSRSLASSGIADPDAIDDKLLEEVDAGSSKM